jgi:hypothetical protein
MPIARDYRLVFPSAERAEAFANRTGYDFADGRSALSGIPSRQYRKGGVRIGPSSYSNRVCNVVYLLVVGPLANPNDSVVEERLRARVVERIEAATGRRY